MLRNFKLISYFGWWENHMECLHLGSMSVVSVQWYGNLKGKKKKKEEEEEDTSAGRYGKMGGFELGQSDCGSKWIILSGLKMDLGQSGCGLGWVDPYFHMIFFFLRKQHVFAI